MSIVYRKQLPFSLTWSLDDSFSNSVTVDKYYDDENECINDGEGDICFSFSESKESVFLKFEGDPDSKLLLYSMDLNPQDEEKGCKNEPYKLTATTEQTRFRVGEYVIRIKTEKGDYFAKVEVTPRWLDDDQHKKMVDYLEEKIMGLSYDLVRQNMGFSEDHTDEDKDRERKPPEKLFKYLVIMHYSDALTAALMDIADNPRSRIETSYEEQNLQKNPNIRFDNYSLRKYITRSGNTTKAIAPKKQLTYDIQDNRMVKMIMTEYIKALNEYINALKVQLEFSDGVRKRQFQKSASRNIENAQKQKKIIAILMATDWYQTVSMPDNLIIPQACMLDTRYNILFKMYQHFRGEMVSEINVQYGFSRKVTSELYENWCYFKIADSLQKNGYKITRLYDRDYGEQLIPDMRIGTRMRFRKSLKNPDSGKNYKLTAELVYNQKIKGFEEDGKPLCYEESLAKEIHNWPDTILHIYIDGIYIGSFIFEIKYRNLDNVLNTSDDEVLKAYSSVEQLIQYDQFHASTDEVFFTYNTIGYKPVAGLFVCHPGEIETGPRWARSTKVESVCMKPDHDSDIDNKVMKILADSILSRAIEVEKLQKDHPDEINKYIQEH